MLKKSTRKNKNRDILWSILLQTVPITSDRQYNIQHSETCSRLINPTGNFLIHQSTNVDVNAVVEVAFDSKSHFTQRVVENREKHRIFKNSRLCCRDTLQRSLEEERESQERIDGDVSQRHIPVYQMAVNFQGSRVVPSACIRMGKSENKTQRSTMRPHVDRIIA